MAKFYNSIKNTFVNSFLMAIRHLPYTITMLVISALPIAFLYIPMTEVASALLLIFIIMGFATIAYCHSLFFVKIFDQYIPKETEESEASELSELTELTEELPSKEQSPTV